MVTNKTDGVGFPNPSGFFPWVAMVVGLVISGDGNSAFNIQQIGRHPVEREKHFHI